MIRVFHQGQPAADSTAPQPAVENEVNKLVGMAAASMERTLARLAATLAELDATELPRPGPDGKVYSSAQQAYDERLREVQGKLAARQLAVPSLSHGLANEREPEALTEAAGPTVRPSGQS